MKRSGFIDYRYNIHTNCMEVFGNSDEVKICFVAAGTIAIKKDMNSIQYKQGEIFVLTPYDQLPLIKFTGVLIELSMNVLIFNRFAFYNIEHEKSVYSERHDFLKRHFLEVISQIKKQQWFDADVSVIKLINYVRMYNYYNPEDIKVLSPVIKQVLDYINVNYQQGLTLNDLAQQFYVNPSYLSRLFSKEMNITMGNYIKKFKIYKIALEMLITQTTEGFYEKYGYKNYSTYNKNFKSVFGVPPEQFLQDRKKLKVNDNRYKNFTELKNFCDGIETA